MKKILITGAGGYIGTELCEFLSSCGYKIFALDTFWFGNKIKDKKIKIIKKDIRYLKEKEFPKNIHCVLHLAAISNDPSAELDPKLSWDVNVLGLLNILNLSAKKQVKKFIFASSGSVYGIKKEKKVSENLSLLPISEYNKTKMVGERLVKSFNDHMKTVILRPATVCGTSKNIRLDLTINMLTFQAIKKKQITVFGGKQYRPNLTLIDMMEVYHFFLKNNLTGIFNVGFENEKILSIAKKISNTINKVNISITKSNDLRSYRLDSQKLLDIGFVRKSNIKKEIKKLKVFYLNKKFKFKKEMIRLNFLKKKK